MNKNTINKSKNSIMLILLVLIAIFCLYSLNSASGAENITISNSSSIKGAVDDGSNYDTIILENGTYSGKNNTNILINRNITIIGKYANGAILDGERKSSFFETSRGVYVKLINLTFINGFNSGYSSFFISGGGAIQNYGELSIINSYFINNTQNSSLSFSSGGGAIKNVGNLSINNSYFINNYGVNGGAIFNVGELNINDSLFINNKANFHGNDIYNSWKSEFYVIGGIGPNYIISEGIAKIDKSHFVNNLTGTIESIYNNGLMSVDDSVFNSTSIYDIYNMGHLTNNTSLKVINHFYLTVAKNFIIPKKNSNVPIAVILKDGYGVPVANKVIKFYFNNIEIGQNITNSEGLALFHYTFKYNSKLAFVFEEKDYIKLAYNSDVYLSDLIPYVLGDFDELVKSGTKESDNVILKFKLSPASDPHLGILSVWVDITLFYKNNNKPLSNQIVYLIVGNETISYITDENGKISDVFHANKSGLIIFQFLFNGSKIIDNGLIIDLKSVSAYSYYFFSDSIDILLPKPYPPRPTDIDHINNPKKFNVYKLENNNSNIMEKNNKNTAYGKMKGNGIALIAVLLSLLCIFGVYLSKKS
ncbi:MAG: hypothetical protein LBU40_03735 [Methanobrevibacter sp.]|jgi:hypothetical protein|nr:hypothetical protein [Methanobrevibacter sp.]